MLGIDWSFWDAVFWSTTTGVQIAIGVASFRRCRCLSRYPMWQSILVAYVSGAFAPIWLVMWTVDRRSIAAEWEQFRASMPADAEWRERSGLVRTSA